MTLTLVLSGAGGARRVEAWEVFATAALRDEARGGTNRWIKSLRLVPYDGRPMRDRFTYRGDSLWWFTELYLQKMRRLETAVIAVRTLDAMLARHAPARVVLDGADPTTAVAALAWGAARGVAIETPGARQLSPWPERRQGAAIGWEAVAARLRRRPRLGQAGVAAFVHTAFVRGGDVYIGRVLDAVAARGGPDTMRLVGVGPQRSWASRRARGAGAAGGAAITPIEAYSSIRALGDSRALWHRRHHLAAGIVDGAAIREAARVDGVDLWAVLEADLRGAALVQWPWSARAMDEAGAALDALTPHTAVTYAEAGGVGRALVLEARRRGIRSIGLQHGFIYRHWLNYRHEPDEWDVRGDDRGVPAPELTLAFDGYTAGHLTTAGRFPPARVCVTGSPGRDDLVGRLRAVTPAVREAARTAAGVSAAAGRLAVLTAKFSEIRDDLPALVDAMRTMTDVHLAIKAHPAETTGVYMPIVSGIPNITVLGAEADLAALLAAADVIVTKNSTVAVDGLVLGIPALVIGLPNNLSPLVDAGVMAGAGTGDAITAALRRVLYDQETRHRLRAAADDFVAAQDLRARGTAADDAAAIILKASH